MPEGDNQLSGFYHRNGAQPFSGDGFDTSSIFSARRRRASIRHYECMDLLHQLLSVNFPLQPLPFALFLSFLTSLCQMCSPPNLTPSPVALLCQETASFLHLPFTHAVITPSDPPPFAPITSDQSPVSTMLYPCMCTTFCVGWSIPSTIQLTFQQSR